MLRRLIVVLAVFNLAFSYETASWEKQMRGVNELDIKTISVDPNNLATIYIGASKALYKSVDSGQSYQPILTIRGDDHQVNGIALSSQSPSTIYAATDSGLYASFNAGQTWLRVYQSSDAQERICLSVIQIGNQVYLGTKKGLFTKSIQERSWRKVKETLDSKPVYYLQADQNNLFITTDREVFKLDTETQKVEKVFSTDIRQEGQQAVEEQEEIEPGNERPIQFLTLHHHKIFLAASNGIFQSTDMAKSWQNLNSTSIPLKEISSLIVVQQGSQEILLAGTSRGAFVFNGGRWTPIYKGMETNDVRFLAGGAPSTVYAATDRGVFTLAVGEMPPLEHSRIISDSGLKSNPIHPSRAISHFKNEPTINEVHQMAIEYAEVSPAKIKGWRQAAKRKALLPSLSLGLDRSATELFHWDTGGNPDTLSKGKDSLDWDVSLSWDLGDLIWNNDQTSIDSRSKLMVELREDVLDQVTRLYFERRRLQVELASPSLDEPIKMDKELRLEELTALLDGFTGGSFSKKSNNGTPSHQDTVSPVEGIQ